MITSVAFFIVQDVFFSVAWVSILSFAVFGILGEWRHPDFDKNVFLQEYYQMLISTSTSSLFMTLAHRYLPDGYYDNPVAYGVGYLLLSTVAYVLMFDMINYWCHRLLHVPWFYKHFHSLHHSYRPVMSMSWASISVVDTLIISLLPIWVPIGILNLVGYGIWRGMFYIAMTIIMIQSLYFHSIWGHVIPEKWRYLALVDNRDHLKHHIYHRCNYANVFKFWDWIMNTYTTDKTVHLVKKYDFEK